MDKLLIIFMRFQITRNMDF